MGSFCSCLGVNDLEDYVNPNNHVYNRNCRCLRCFLQNFRNVGRSIFHRGEVHSVPGSIQGAAAMTSTASLDNSLSDMYRSPPRPLPYDVDPRYFRSQQDGLVSRRDKGSSHLNEESEPLRGDVDVEPESLSSGDKRYGCTGDDGSKEYRSKSSVRLSSAKLVTGAALVYGSSSEDEDVCPTCLEEYTEENPRIMTKCSHHYHLGCIYEWMERSDSCPVCGKVMDFDETT
ncbi:E3 ubiquitin-protein ligase At3g02290-like [Lotus japonicus]|uniref:E3 ubiquitin-protein ligase At3g02290-like n=1 Tax=Lotus japonicus TaxID=34305 RepID=UPI00258B8D3D|nr:E3 ubiquitin-protein ligase At3g02290-like [Lotus japonicus]